jgi:hypothetical protein
VTARLASGGVVRLGGKETWSAHLPPFRQGAVGRLGPGEVFVLAVLDRDRLRYIRLQLSVVHARTLAAELLTAADRATDTPASDPEATPGPAQEPPDDAVPAPARAPSPRRCRTAQSAGERS